MAESIIAPLAAMRPTTTGFGPPVPPRGARAPQPPARRSNPRISSPQPKPLSHAAFRSDAGSLGRSISTTAPFLATESKPDASPPERYAAEIARRSRPLAELLASIRRNNDYFQLVEMRSRPSRKTEQIHRDIAAAVADAEAQLAALRDLELTEPLSSVANRRAPEMKTAVEQLSTRLAALAERLDPYNPRAPAIWKLRSSLERALDTAAPFVSFVSLPPAAVWAHHVFGPRFQGSFISRHGHFLAASHWSGGLLSNAIGALERVEISHTSKLGETGRVEGVRVHADVAMSDPRYENEGGVMGFTEISLVGSGYFPGTVGNGITAVHRPGDRRPPSGPPLVR